MRLFLLVAVVVAQVALAQGPANTTAPASNTTNTPASLNTTASTNTTNTPVAASVPRAPGGCVKTCVRKEFRSLTADEKKAYLDAIRRLQTIPARTPGASAGSPAQAAPGAPTEGLGIEEAEFTESRRLVRRQNPAAPANATAPAVAALTGPSEYDRLVKMHLDASKFAHGTDFFLPWHRAYLREFEKAIQSINPELCGVYWNWAIDSQAAEYAPVFDPAYYGGNGQGPDNCVADGAFAGWKPTYPEPHCLRRSFAYEGGLGAFHSIEAVNRAISTIKDYPRFRKHVEGVLHPNCHIGLGGDMTTMDSPNDPIFWLHHGFVDYMWSRWQKRNGFGFSADPNAALEFVEGGYRAASVLDHRELCYDYGELSEADMGDVSVVPPPPPMAKSPVGKRAADAPLPELTKIVPLPVNVPDADRYSSRDRGNLVSLRYADKPSAEWCERNNIAYEENEGYQEEYRKVYSELNQVKGYVSPCALMKRPTLQVRLIQYRKVEQFYVDVPEVGRIEVSYKEEVAKADPYQAVAHVTERVFACSPDVERPPEEYRATIQKLIGPSAFSGAADPLRRVTDMDGVTGSATTSAVGKTVAAAALAVAGFVQMW